MTTEDRERLYNARFEATRHCARADRAEAAVQGLTFMLFGAGLLIVGLLIWGATR